MTKATILRCIEDMDNKLAELRNAVEKLPEAAEVTPAGLLPEQAGNIAVEQPRTIRFVDKHKLRPLVANIFSAMGIRGEPIGAEKVQEMIAACGVQPEDNLFSRGVIEMRDPYPSSFRFTS
jgi:hypothetical protein